MPYIYILKDKWFSKGEGCVVIECNQNSLDLKSTTRARTWIEEGEYKGCQKV